LFDILKAPILSFQEFFVLTGQAIRNLVRRPHYWNDIFLQMDSIGVGSVPIVILVGFFSGAVMALQMSRALATYGAQGQVGKIVAITLVRELGPVLSALLVAGRNASGIASELGSMKVTEQVDAMRALGTDPTQKLVTPRVIAMCFVLPCLTAIADMVGVFGSFVIAVLTVHSLTGSEFWNTAYQSLEWNDLTQGLLKPFLFALVISLVGCYYGIRTTGGTQGVGRSTTQAVVVASVWIFIVDLLVTQIFVSQAP
jgi:phospholipid/cholesterol/gamma-HCH transport system permease protein